MEEDPPIGRRTPIHGVSSTTNNPIIIFLTVCTKDRAKWLASEEVHQLLHTTWESADHWMVGRYILMPDHLHFFASPKLEFCSTLEAWMKYWKAQFTRSHDHSDWRWQRSHWDRRLRANSSYTEKWDYVRNNPVRAGLVKHPDDWQFQDEIHTLSL